MQKQTTSIKECKNIKIVNLKIFTKNHEKLQFLLFLIVYFITVDFNDIFSIYITNTYT